MGVHKMGLSSRSINSRETGQSKKIEAAQNPRKTLLRFIKYFQPYWIRLSIIFFFVTISTIATIAGPYLLGRAIDRYMARSDLKGLSIIVLWMAFAAVIDWAAQVSAGVMIAKISQKVLKKIRTDLFEHLQTMSVRFYDQNSHGELMSRLTNDVDAINQAVSQNVTLLFGSVLTLSGVVIAMFLLNLWLTLVTLVAIPLMMVLVTRVTRHTRKSYRTLQSQIGQLNGLMEENVSGLREMKIFRRSQTAMEAFDQQNNAVCDKGIDAQTFALLMMPLMTVLSNLNIGLVAGIGGWMAINGIATIGNIASFIGYTRTFAHPLRQIGNLFNTIQSALAGAERIFEVIDEQSELTNTSAAIVPAQFHGEVIFKNVEFGYKPQQTIIEKMNIHALPGQMIALVGPTGAGKTTIVNLLTRFYDIQGGQILIDGQDIRGFQQESLRQQLGIVLQDAYLFSESVLENIRYGRLDASDEEIYQAATLANAHHFILRLPQGYQTILSERGSNLSQGQRQLLTIARAILADPSILILDEATSSVDTRTEIRIQEALLRLMHGRTSFVIAHRLSTIRNADQVLVIDQGRIIEQGTHATLLKAKGFYYQLYVSQFKGIAI
jgi:ATP-binding cassette subfamily B protein